MAYWAAPMCWESAPDAPGCSVEDRLEICICQWSIKVAEVTHERSHPWMSEKEKDEAAPRG